MNNSQRRILKHMIDRADTSGVYRLKGVRPLVRDLCMSEAAVYKAINTLVEQGHLSVTKEQHEGRTVRAYRVGTSTVPAPTPRPRPARTAALSRSETARQTVPASPPATILRSAPTVPPAPRPAAMAQPASPPPVASPRPDPKSPVTRDAISDLINAEAYSGNHRHRTACQTLIQYLNGKAVDRADLDRALSDFRAETQNIDKTITAAFPQLA